MPMQGRKFFKIKGRGKKDPPFRPATIHGRNNKKRGAL
jgi:hypothetical protein